MEEFNKYMEEFKTYTLDEKKEIAIEQLKLLTSLTNTMCTELKAPNEVLITTDSVEALRSDDDFVEAVVVYANSIQNSLCDLTDKITELLEKQISE